MKHLHTLSNHCLMAGMISLLMMSSRSPAQDNHYWSQQFGAVSTMMGGAVVGGVEDNSAIFYNPAALGFVKNANLSLDANIYKYDKISLEDGAGEGVNLNSAQMSIYPQLVSGLITLPKFRDLTLAYTIMTRNHSNILMNTRYTKDDFTGYVPPEVDDYLGAFEYTNQVTEQWFGLGFGYRFNEKLATGGTFVLNYRTQTYQLSNYIRAVQKDDTTGRYNFTTLNLNDAVKYRTFGLLVKLGVTYRTDNWDFGLTLTTPSMTLYGSGDVQREFSLYQDSEEPSDTGFNFLIMDRQTKVHARYRNPFSIAAGAAYHTFKTRLGVSAEYYFGISSYTIMNPGADPFVFPPGYDIPQEIGEEFLMISTASKPVLNAGIGISQQVAQKLTFMGGFRTDFGTYKKTEGEDFLLIGSTNWDIYHFTAGISYRQERHIITLGGQYSFTPRRNIDSYTDISLYGGDSKATIHANSYAFVIGYTYFFPK